MRATNQQSKPEMVKPSYKAQLLALGTAVFVMALGIAAYSTLGTVVAIILVAIVILVMFLVQKLLLVYKDIESRYKAAAYKYVVNCFRPIDLLEFTYISLPLKASGSSIREAARLSYKLATFYSRSRSEWERLYALTIIQGKNEESLPKGFTDALDIGQINTSLISVTGGKPEVDEEDISNRIAGLALAYTAYLEKRSQTRELESSEKVEDFCDFLVDYYKEKATSAGESQVDEYAEVFNETLRCVPLVDNLKKALKRDMPIDDDAGLPEHFIDTVFVRPRARHAFRERLPKVLTSFVRRPFLTDH